MIIAEIIPITSSILTESLSYFSAEKITPGTLVTIPLRKQKIKGIVISTLNVKDIKQSLRTQNFKIRNIIEIHQETIFSKEYLDAINQLKKYYLIPAGKLINLTYPKYIINNFTKFSYQKGKKKRQYHDELKKEKIILQDLLKNRLDFYKKTIFKNFKNEISTHIICPTVIDVENISSRLDKLINKEIQVFHGKLSKKKCKDSYEKIKTNPSVIVSTPQYLDLPIFNRATIIIENDSSPYYRNVKKPHIDFRNLIESYAEKLNVHLIIADNILRPFRLKERNKNVNFNIFNRNKIHLLNSIDRIIEKQSDEERIKSLSYKREFSPFSRETLKAIKKSIKNKEKIFFFTHRKSLSPQIVCRNCGKLAQDPITKTPYSLHASTKKQNTFFYVNRLTGDTIPAFDTCQFCGSWRLQTLGIGTETVQKKLIQEFPSLASEISIIDSSHVKTKTELKKAIKEFNKTENKPKIIVGTQKAIPYMKNIDTSFIVSIDGMFSHLSYTTEDRILKLIKDLHDNSNTLFIQTRYLNRKNSVLFYHTDKDINEETNENKFNIKLTKKLKSLFDKIKYSSELQNKMYSRYTEYSKIWELLKNGDYRSYVNKYLDINNDLKTIIKINHLSNKDNYLQVIDFYENRFNTLNFNIRHQYLKKGVLIIIVLFIEKKFWNPSFQEDTLYQKMILNDRNISIEIDPETF